MLWGRSSSVYYVEVRVLRIVSCMMLSITSVRTNTLSQDLDSDIATWKTVKGLRDRINWYPVALAAPNTSAVIEIADKLFPWIWESGMLKAHSTYSSLEDRSPDNWDRTSSQRSGELRFEDLEGVFLLLVCGLILSLLVFFIEIIAAIIKTRAKLKRRHNSRGMMIPGETFGAREF